MVLDFSTLNGKPSRKSFAWVTQATRTKKEPGSGLLTEKKAAAWLGISLSTLRRIRKIEKIGFYEVQGRIRYSLQQLQDYVNSVSKNPCLPQDIKLENTGSPSDPVLQTTMQHISTPGLDKQSAYLLAKATFKKPK